MSDFDRLCLNINALLLTIALMVFAIIECIKNGHHAFFFLFGASITCFEVGLFNFIRIIKRWNKW